MQINKYQAVLLSKLIDLYFQTNEEKFASGEYGMMLLLEQDLKAFIAEEASNNLLEVQDEKVQTNQSR